MNKKGYTTESGGRQNGFAIEPEINPYQKANQRNPYFYLLEYYYLF